MYKNCVYAIYIVHIIVYTLYNVYMYVYNNICILYINPYKRWSGSGSIIIISYNIYTKMSCRVGGPYIIYVLYFSQKQLPRKMKSRFVITTCAGYIFKQLFLRRLYTWNLKAFPPDLSCKSEMRNRALY